MKTFKYMAIGLCLSLVSVMAGAGETPSAREIMDKQKKLHTASKEIEYQKMMLVDKNRGKKIREVKRFSFEYKNDVYKYCLTFISPRDVKATTLLTHQQDGADDLQWLYLPALGKKLKRISGGSKKGYFMGTDYTYEDLSADKLDDFEYKHIKEEEFKGKPCWVIESKAKTPYVKQSTGYSKKIYWIRKDIFFTVKTEYYNKRDQHIKTQTFMKIKNVGGDLYRADRMLMNNFSKKHMTAVIVTNRKINNGAKIDEGLFTERSVIKEEPVDK